MHRRLLTLVTLLLAIAVPLSASQFVELAFDQVARESRLIVRGHVERTWTAWDDSREVIYTYAQVRVSRFLGEATGPDVIVVREVGGTVDGYTQEAIGFPMLRDHEQVVLFLSNWEDSGDYRIHAFNQGKFLVRNRAGVEVAVPDPVKQGDVRLEREGKTPVRAEAEGPGLTMDELSNMIEDARAGGAGIDARRQH
jgi:hypothetical protein